MTKQKLTQTQFDALTIDVAEETIHLKNFNCDIKLGSYKVAHLDPTKYDLSDIKVSDDVVFEF